MVGETLGHYRIEATLGAGGMGVVYLAQDTHLNRPVALKVLSRSSLDATAREDLLREGRAASALNHPNVCTVHEVGDAHGQMFMVMEYVDGAPLNRLIPPGGLALEQVLRYGIQMADALEHAHDRGVVHGDLKTANMMVTSDGRIKVLDFGLARRRLDWSRDETTRVRSGSDAASLLAGTLAYMAPEILRGEGAATPSDIWALGMVLYEISTGKLPFHGTTTFELTADILHEPVAPLPAHVPPSLRAIILRCLAKDAPQRYRRAGEVRAALEAVDSSVRVSRHEVVAVPRRRWPWLATAGVLVVGSAAGVWAWRHFSASEWERAGGRLTPLALAEGRAFDPALSPDGKIVAYVAETPRGQLDLFIARVAGGTPVQLTDDDTTESYPRFSPDGERIVFARRHAGTGASELSVTPTFGGEIRTVVLNAAQPVWAPDGKRFAYIQREPTQNAMVLMTSAIDGTDARVLLRADGSYPFLRNPAWSPDGRRIAIVRSSGGIAAEIWTVPASGGAAIRVVTDPANTFSDDPVFTPDSRAVIHSSNRGGATNIWVVSLNGQAPVRLTTGSGPDESPTVARDGTIAYVNSRWRHVLITHDLQTAATRSLTSITPFIWAPVLSPDGREIAFSRGEVDGSWHIWVMPASGGSPTQLTAGVSGEVYSRYLPDGSLVYHTWGAPHRIWRIARSGGPPEALTAGPDDRFGDVSADGRWLAFVRAEQQAERIYIAPVAGGSARRLTESPGSIPRWSPDGALIAFSKDRGYSGGIFLIGADGTAERRLADQGGWPVWWPDGRHVGYRIIAPDGNQQIMVASLQGGPPSPIDTLKYTGVNEPFDLWRDGRTLVTSNAVHVSDEIWLIRRDR